MSLYRKYRPQTFEDVVGQEHVARTLRNALTANPPRVAHAYLFTGPRGIGKTTNARLLAKCLNCSQGPTPRPCNQCDFCVRVAQNQPVMDLVEIDAASNTGVGDVRETIIEKVNMAPAEGRYRIYIIDEVHMLSNSAFNALLKTLEEPPAHAIFVLATTETHKVPATILSRCQRFDFRRVTPPDIVKRLQYVAKCENIQLNEEAARLIARHADGALRDALTLLEQVIAFSGETVEPADVRLVLGGVPQELLHGLVQSVAEGDARGVLEIIEQAVNEGASFSQMARDLSSYARDLLLVTVGFDPDETLSAEEKQLRSSHAQALGRARIEALLSALRDTEKEMKTANDHRLLLELTLVRASEGLLPQAPTIQQSAAPRPVAPWRDKLAPARPTEIASTETTKAETPPAAPPVVREIKVTLPPPEEVEVPVVAHSNGVVPIESEPEVEQVTSMPSEETEVAYADEAMAMAEEYEQAPSIVSEEHGMTAPPVQEFVPAPEEEMVPEPEAVAEAPAAKKKGRRISNFEELVELWPKLLIRIRTKIGVTAVAYLHDARPVGFTNDEIVLEFTKEFHYAKANEASGRLPFEEKINEVLDKPRHLRFQLAAPVVKAPEPVVEEPSNDDDDDDDLYGGNIVEYTQNVFAADIVARSG